MHLPAALSGQQFHLLVFSYVFFSGVVLVAWLLFVGSIARTLRLVPREQRMVPSWLLWLTTLLALSYALSWLIPWQIVTLLCALIGLVFTWLILPFAVPRSLLRIAGSDGATARSVRVLGYVGLVNQIAITLMYLLKVFLFLAGPQASGSLMMPAVGGVLNMILPAILALIGATAIITWVFYWARMVSVRSELG
jgi:hypothetical protein